MRAKITSCGGALISLAALGAAGGCGGSQGAASENACALLKDGTRLKAFRLQAEDGAWENRSRFLNWHDSLLATPCTFVLAADGVPRCLPAVAFEWVNGFADAACSQRVTAARRCVGVPRHAMVPLAERCAGVDAINPYAVYALGAASVPDVLYLQDRDAAGNPACVAAPNSERREFYPLLSEVPPTEFVAATVERTAGPRIQTNQIAAEDGARGRDLSLAFDSAFGTECIVTLAADGEWRCLPFQADLFRPRGYADAACTQLVAGQGGRRCNPGFRVRFAGIEEERVCATFESGSISTWPAKLHVHELDPPNTPAEIYSKTLPANGATCEAMPNADGSQFSRYRAELAPTEFVRAIDKEIACGPLGGSGRRLKAHHLVSDGDVALGGWTATWVDAETGQACNFRVAADGVLRCLPSEYLSTSGAVRWFADASCNRVLVNVSRCRDNVRGAPKFVVWDEVADECIAGVGYVETRTVVHALGAAITPSALYAYNSEQPARCLPIDEVGLGRIQDLVLEFEFRELGSEVSPSTFVAGTVDTP